MKLHFKPQEEELLSQLACHAGTDTEHLVKDAVLKLLDEDRLLREGVERGLTASQCGEFVESREVWAKVEKLLQF